MKTSHLRLTASRPTSLRSVLLLTLLFATTLAGCGGGDSNSQTTAPATSQDRPTLSWKLPASREDGSRLYQADIKEFRVYYRLRHQDSFQTIRHSVDRGTALRLNQFQPGAYEFSVSTVDTDGIESRRSKGVSVDLI